jgi:hypothetical protein
MADIRDVLRSAVQVCGKLDLMVDPDTGEHAPFVLQRVGKGKGNLPLPGTHDLQLRSASTWTDRRSPAQLAGRARIAAATAAWHAMTDAEREPYRKRARRRRMTGFNLAIREFCQAHPLAEFA